MEYFNQILKDIVNGNTKLKQSVLEATGDLRYGEIVKLLLDAKKHKSNILRKIPETETGEDEKFILNKLDERISRYNRILTESNKELLKNISNDIDHYLYTKDRVEVLKPADAEMN